MSQASKGFLQQARALLDDGRAWAGLGGDALAFVLADLCQSGRWLVVVDEPDAYDRLISGLSFFLTDRSRLAPYPADDCRPYDGFSPSPQVVRRRLKTLAQLEGGGDILVVAPGAALAPLVPDAGARRSGRQTVATGDVLDRDELVSALITAGYLVSAQVMEEGFVARRGDIVDVWPTFHRHPVRIDFFDDEVESVRAFHPGTRRTVESLERVTILPAREERLDAEALRRASTELARWTTEQRRDNRLRRRILEDLKAGIRFSGLSAYLPALVSTEAPLQAMSGLQTLVVSPEDVAAALRDWERNARDRWSALDDTERPLVPPEERAQSAEEVLEQLKDAHKVWDLAAQGQAVDLGARAPDGYSVRGADLKPVVRKLRQLSAAGVRVGLVCDTEKRADTLREMLDRHELYPVPRARPTDLRPEQVAILVGDLPRGFVAQESGWAFIPASALFGGAKRRARMDRIHAFFDASVTSVEQIREEDLVVHRLHGVGRYRGLKRMDAQDGVVQDFATVEFRGGDLLYLPVTRLSDLSRYVPSKEGAKIKLDKLGGVSWEKRKDKVRDSLLGMARELLTVTARREVATREAYPAAGDLYAAFEARFPYEETPDQLAAIEAIDSDLSATYPMDRLLCGDVGFGKTEVAMRAAMRAAESGRQVAVLCPTTVLAYQHRQTFQKRFDGLPVSVAMLSRFQDAKQERDVLARLQTGEVDILVGTTAILGRKTRFSNLGLLVIDEEHRFGVRQKERFKKLRAEVDVLSMSATPIPRTLQMGLSGVREMSLMATPPRDRLAVRTSVSRMTQARVRDAVLHELGRGGQVYFVHNRVETIGKLAERLASWVPEARFVVAHGQMNDQKLEQVLLGFMNRKSDVLVCTAIMENGIDLPNVNTMLIHRADRFGLAQLYQLRGRVGRGNVRASCLLLVPEELTGEARRRVQILVENTRLGSGFSVAAADLEMRGAGNMLGDAQSGNIDSVGYEVWLELLEQAVGQARGHYEARRIEPEVEVPVPAFLPDTFIADPEARLRWYQRLSGSSRPGELDHFLDELEAQMGSLPQEAINLCGLLQTILYCRSLGIQRCIWMKVRVVFELHPTSPIDVARLEALETTLPKRMTIRNTNPVEWTVRFTPAEAEHPFRFLRWVLARLERDTG